MEDILNTLLYWTWFGLLGGYILFSISHFRLTTLPPRKTQYWEYIKGFMFTLLLGPLIGFFIGIKLNKDE